MKVLHYISGISPTVGGIEKFVLNFYEAQRDNIELHILTRYYIENSKMIDMFRKNNIKVYSLNIHHLGIGNLYDFKKKLEVFFNEHKDEYDVFHVHCVTDPFVVSVAKKFHVKKILTHVHSYINKKVCLSNLLKYISIYENSCKSDLCLACSEDVGLATYPLKCISKFKVINNGINAVLFEYNENLREKLRKKWNIQNEFVISNIGRLESVKNHDFLIDIFNSILNKYDNSLLIIIGDGVLKEQLIEKCKKLNICHKVLFMGEQEEVSEFLLMSDVFVLPSKNEGLGIAAIEAQASGLMTFVSKDVVPQMVDCTGLVNFIGLEKSADYWAEIILSKALSYDRKSTYNIFLKNGFDNKYSSGVLIDLYENN